MRPFSLWYTFKKDGGILLRCGIDTVEIHRIEKSMERASFLERYFSKDEQILFEKRKWKPSVVAGNFAAKEAFSKALGTGIRNFSLAEVSVLRDELGAPFFTFEGKAKELAKEFTFSVSITNTKTLATAMVIAY